MAMGINGLQGGAAMAAAPVQNTQPKQQVQAPKIEDPAQSTLLDTEKEQERMQKMQDEAMKRVQEQTKEQMSAEQHAASAMGFGSKLQMELTGTA
jgi:hypothetical protein